MHHATQQLKEERKQKDQSGKCAGGGRRRVEDPAAKQEQQRSWSKQTAAKIIENLPAVDQRQSIRLASRSRARGHPWQDPRRNLPVSAYPAVLPFAVARVVVGKLFEQFHIRGETDADMHSFDQVVTQQTLFGETPRENFVEGPDVVDSFSVINPFPKDVLIKIRDCLTVGIAPTSIGK